jgi:hypothetical protein
MQIEITYADGTTETVIARLKADMVLQGSDWRPGIEVETPTRCYFGNDVFEGYLNEMGDTEGKVEPDEDELDEALDGGRAIVWETFSWQLDGTPEDECRGQIAKWVERLGRPVPVGSDGVPEGVRPEQAAEYLNDQACWTHYLGDLQVEIDNVVALVGVRPVPRPF